MSFDREAILASNSVSSVIGKYFPLTRSGREFKCLCPFHADSEPSLTINDDKGFFHCFACGAHGNAIDFIMDYCKVSFPDACAILGGDKNAPKVTPAQIKKRAPVDYYADLEDAPDAPELEAGKQVIVWNHKQQKESRITPTMVFPYLGADGILLGYVLRLEINGQKWTPTVRYCSRPTGETQWTIAPFPELRPLYGMDRLNETGQVLIGEGEKTADALYRIFGLPAITWPGGTNGVRYVDWSSVLGRRVLIFADQDDAGEKAANEVAEACHKAGATEIKVIGWDRSKPKGWDVADAEKEGMTKADIVAWGKPFMKVWTPSADVKKQEPEPEQKEEENGVYDSDGSVKEAEHKGRKISAHSQTYDVPYNEDAPPPPPEPEDRGEPYCEREPNWEPFRFLGFNGDVCHYMPNDTCQIIELNPSQHTKNNLLFLAPLEYWESTYPQNNGKFNVDFAMNAMVQKSKSIGFFDYENVRGRGAWIEKNRSVVNLGTQIYSEGAMCSVGEFKSPYIYEASKPLAVNITSPATTKEAQRLVDVCRRLSWEKMLSADLLVGWCVVAPVCGALRWRSHIWITGSASSGKSTVIKNIIKPIVGEIALNGEGNSSEAYIRQMIDRDARPVIMDEAESEDRSQIELMQKVLGLARISSSGGAVGKGGADGNAKTYSVRSCFCFSSINTSIYQHADESRISKLVMRKNEAPDADDAYLKLMADINEWFTQEYSEKLFARTVANLPTLLKNAETFTSAAAAVLNSRRAADQIGTMLAGRYLCNSTKEIDFLEAAEWIRERKDLLLEYTSVASTNDEKKLLTRLMTHRVRVQGDNATHDLTIGELVLAADGGELPLDITRRSVSDELKRYGLKVDTRDDGVACLYIANGSPAIEKILKDTVWAKADLSRPLRALPGASPTKAIYYNAGLTARGTSIPLGLIKQQKEE